MINTFKRRSWQDKVSLSGSHFCARQQGLRGGARCVAHGLQQKCKRAAQARWQRQAVAACGSTGEPRGGHTGGGRADGEPRLGCQHSVQKKKRAANATVLTRGTELVRSGVQLQEPVKSNHKTHSTKAHTTLGLQIGVFPRGRPSAPSLKSSPIRVMHSAPATHLHTARSRAGAHARTAAVAVAVTLGGAPSPPSFTARSPPWPPLVGLRAAPAAFLCAQQAGSAPRTGGSGRGRAQ